MSERLSGVACRVRNAVGKEWTVQPDMHSKLV